MTPPNNPLLSFTPTPPLSGSYLSSLSPPFLMFPFYSFFLFLFPFLSFPLLSSPPSFSFFSLFLSSLFFPFFSFLFLSFFSFPFLFFSFPFPSLVFPSAFLFFSRRQRNFTDNILTGGGVSHPTPPPFGDAPGFIYWFTLVPLNVIGVCIISACIVIIFGGCELRCHYFAPWLSFILALRSKFLNVFKYM